MLPRKNPRRRKLQRKPHKRIGGDEQPEPQETADENGHREVENGVGASPSVRKLAQEYEIDLAEVTGSGSGGRVTREDVERLIREQIPPHDHREAEREAPERGWQAEASASLCGRGRR